MTHSDLTSDETLRILIQKTNDRLGYTPATPYEFIRLIDEIKKTTGETLSLSSIKRLWGYVEYQGSFSSTTLNILARFNGSKDIESFRESISKISPEPRANDSGFLAETVKDTSVYSQGDRLLLEWDNEKNCLLECVGNMRFRIVDSKNIKLQPDDTVTLHTICIGEPFYVTDISRGDTTFAAYVGAKKNGIKTIREFR